jgi:hypothetical protein
MRLFDVGQEAHGVIAIGQVATGVVAIGQMATGVIAIGQLARGGIAIGMLSFGLLSIGMLSFGLIWAGGMGGLAGRRGFGVILPLLPSLGSFERPPSPRRAAALGPGDKGWIAALLEKRDGELLVSYQGTPLELAGGARISPDANGLRSVLAHVTHAGHRLVCDRLMRPARANGLRAIGAALQLAALLAMAAAYWIFVVVPLREALAL